MHEPEGPSTPAATCQTEAHPNLEEMIEFARQSLPDLDELVLENRQPVDNFFAEKQHRLLTEPLFSSWTPEEGRPFLVAANVGLFNTAKRPPQVPDVMLSLDVQVADDLTVKENRSYLMWIIGKPPDVALELVSDRTGGEENYKMNEYARIGVLYYVIFDPRNRLGNGVLRGFALREGEYIPVSTAWLPRAGLGLRLWEGEFEGHHDTWLRWCDHEGNVVPSGRERAEQERARADRAEGQVEKERTRADRLAEQLRALGIDPEA